MRRNRAALKIGISSYMLWLDFKGGTAMRFLGKEGRERGEQKPRNNPSPALAAFLLLAACAAPPGEPLPRLAPAAERIFHADPRWLGGDAAISVDLGDSRILWLFGDSFVDPAPPYARSEAAFVRNAIAVQIGRDPARAGMVFLWRTDASGAPASFFPEDGKDWFWPGGGLVLADGTLALFLHRLRETGDAPPLGFESAGYALALIANPADPPESWRGRIVPGPALPFDAVPGAALIRDDRAVAVLATRSKGGPAGMLVRYDEAALARGDLAGEWWTGSAWVAAHAVPPGGPAIVIDDAGSESSLQPTPCGFLHVASLGFGASVIAARTAPDLTGPWSAPTTLLKPPESSGPRPFVYAGRAHPALPRRHGALFVSYVANAFEPDALTTPAGERDLYWPRLAEIAPPACP